MNNPSFETGCDTSNNVDEREEADKPEEYPLTVCQLVYMANLGVSFNISLLSEVLGGKCGEFPASICRLRVPTSSAMIFSTGCMHVIGANHVDDAILSTYIIEHELVKVGIFANLHSMWVCNVVCSASLGHYIDLKRLKKDYATSCVSSDQFEGVHFTLRRKYVTQGAKRAKVTMVIIFDTGRIVITGGTTVNAIRDDFEAMIPILRKYKLDHKPATSAKRARSSNASKPGGSMATVRAVAARLAKETATGAAATLKERNPKNRGTKRRSHTNERRVKFKPVVGYEDSETVLRSVPRRRHPKRQKH